MTDYINIYETTVYRCMGGVIPVSRESVLHTDMRGAQDEAVDMDGHVHNMTLGDFKGQQTTRYVSTVVVEGQSSWVTEFDLDALHREQESEYRADERHNAGTASMQGKI